MSIDTTPSSATDCFISYKQDDNRDFSGVVDRLSQDLRGQYEAHTGKELRVFIDRESIGWGADWRQSVREAVERATIFIPVVTMRYFTSQACRDELLAFYNNAEQLGVTDLLLPIVLMGQDQITSDDPREEVRLIDRLNHKRIHGAWLAGYESAAWRTMMFDLVSSLDKALLRAEEVLVRRQEQAVTVAASGSAGSDTRIVDQDPDGSADFLYLAEKVEVLVPLLASVLEALEVFSQVAQETVGGVDWASMTTQQQRVRFLAAASALARPSAIVGERGAELQSTTAECDALLRSAVQELRLIGGDMAAEQFRSLVDVIGESSVQLAGVASQLDEATNILKMVSLMNVSLRKALRPGIQGIQAVKSAAGTIDSWTRLA